MLCLLEMYMFDTADKCMHHKPHIWPLLLHITASSLQMLTRHAKKMPSCLSHCHHNLTQSTVFFASASLCVQRTTFTCEDFHALLKSSQVQVVFCTQRNAVATKIIDCVVRCWSSHMGKCSFAGKGMHSRLYTAGLFTSSKCSFAHSWSLHMG